MMSTRHTGTTLPLPGEEGDSEQGQRYYLEGLPIFLFSNVILPLHLSGEAGGWFVEGGIDA